MAIDNTTVVPKLIAARLVAKYFSTRVFAQRTNRAWQSMLANGGNTVQRNQVADGVVADYVKGVAIGYTDVDATALGDLTIDKQKYWGLEVEDIDAIQSVSNLLDATVGEYAERLAIQVDTDVRAVFDAGATAGLAVALDHDNLAVGANSADYINAVDFKFNTMHRLLDGANVPRGSRWLIIGPYGLEVLQGYALQNAVIGAPANAALLNGGVGSYAGFNVYVHGTEHSALQATTATEEWFYGDDTAVAFIDQVREVEQLRSQDNFSTRVRGLYTYGAKVDFATRVYKSVATIANVPA